MSDSRVLNVTPHFDLTATALEANQTDPYLVAYSLDKGLTYQQSMQSYSMKPCVINSLYLEPGSSVGVVIYIGCCVEGRGPAISRSPIKSRILYLKDS
jgi:hypothetical protein